MGLSREFRTNITYSGEQKKVSVLKELSGVCARGGLRHQGSPTWIVGWNGTSTVSTASIRICLRARSTASKVEMPEAQELRQQVGKLKKDLRAAEMLAEAYSMMIGIAKRESKAAIRKKSATK